jgi:hypothetical protein
MNWENKTMLRIQRFFGGALASILKANYFGTQIAELGHSSTQVPQSVQSDSLTTAMSSTLIAPDGHASSHSPQPTHSSAFTLATIARPLGRENDWPIKPFLYMDGGF